MEAEAQPKKKPRQRRRRLKAETVVKLRKLMANGHSPADVARHFKLPYFTVYSIRRGYSYKSVGGPIQDDKVHGVPPSPRKARKIKELRAKGASLDDLAAASGHGMDMIKRTLAGEFDGDDS